ncbi:MAG TPA: RNA polymerase sigma factor [Ktedonobacteraceae bacterium]|jgi:RNA polymerase sigma-70 factor (ECF subfamily)|nr:RNA polymerase sigma factor [Ktedonobacteraceae bacterium]
MIVQGQTDKELLTLLGDNLCKHFELLVLCYQQRLYAFVLGIVHDPYEAEDIVQETFINTYKSLLKLVTVSDTEKLCTLRLKPWLFTIAHHIALNHLNRKGHHMCSIHQPLSVDIPGEREILEELKQGQIASAEEQVESNEERRTLHEKVNCLPDQQRDAVFLHYMVGLEYQDIATKLNRPVNTVKSSGRRGLAKLRGMLLQTVNLDPPSQVIQEN